MHRRPPYSPALKSFALLSPCGFGNLGDAATMEAAIQNLRARIPAARFHGITLNPADTERRHRIPTYPLAGMARPMYASAGRTTAEDKAAQGPAGGAESPQPAGGWRRAKTVGWSVLRAVLRVLLPPKLRENIRVEVAHIAGALRLLKDLDMVVLSGGGQLDDFWGGPWGHPYTLMKWAVLARATNTRLVILCTGFGTLDSRWSRLFVRVLLRLSDYCSYRDAGSRERMQQAGFRRSDPVYPDLAFSLDVAPYTGSSRRPADPRRVCISPMVYCHPEFWPVRDEAAYRQYLRKLAAIAERLIDSGREIVLVASDGADNRSIEELRAVLAARLGEKGLNQLQSPAIESVDDFLREVAQSQFLIASRLHGVVLSHLVGTPAIALSYDRKVRAHMQAVNQAGYCLGIDDFSADSALEAARRLQSRITEEGEALQGKTREFRLRLDAQYDLVLSGHGMQ